MGGGGGGYELWTKGPNNLQVFNHLNLTALPIPFLNSWRVSSHIVRYDTNHPAFRKQHWHSSSQGKFRLKLHSLSVSEQFRIQALRPYSKSSLTLIEWKFNLSFSWVSMLFLISWRVSSHIVRYNTNPPAIQKQQWHSREAQIGTSTHWVWVWVSFWNTGVRRDITTNEVSGYCPQTLNVIRVCPYYLSYI
jgi:hypothetical protein